MGAPNPSTLRAIPWTILDGQSETEALVLDGENIVGLDPPASMTGPPDALLVKGTHTRIQDGGTFRTLNDVDGTKVRIKYVDGERNDVDPISCQSVRQVKLQAVDVSNAAAAQTGDQDGFLMVRRFD